MDGWKIFQIHQVSKVFIFIVFFIIGTQLPEAQKIIEGNHGLERSLDAIDRNVGMLNIVQERYIY